MASVVAGVGYLLGWLRPVLPQAIQSYAHAGNLMQVAAIGLMLAAYCSFFNLRGAGRRVATLLVSVLGIFLTVVLLKPGSHEMIMTGTAAAALLYAGMVVILLAHLHHDRLLVGFMCFFDAWVCSMLTLKVLMGVLQMEYIPFASNNINAILYLSAMVAMTSNGFGLLLLIKKEDDRNLLLAMGEISRKASEQKHFIAMLSHEVRSPLAVIDSATQLLALKLAASVETAPLIERIRRGTHRLIHFFANSLTEDRVRDGDFSPHLETLKRDDLLHWLRDTADILTDCHVVRIHCDHDLPIQLVADETLLRTVLTNLLSNAIKYSPPDSLIQIEFGQDASGWRIAVLDEGPGVPPDEQELVFERYRRGRAAEKTPGAGLGLSVSRQIAQLHGGELWMTNRTEGGACFTLTLPWNPKIPIGCSTGAEGFAVV